MILCVTVESGSDRLVNVSTRNGPSTNTVTEHGCAEQSQERPGVTDREPQRGPPLGDSLAQRCLWGN